jgi:putative addiction module killer protein
MKHISYFKLNNRTPFLDWISGIDAQNKARVLKALERLREGNFSSCKYLGGGLVEMRLFFASGYRVYFTEMDGTIIIILTGGDKKTQKKDIEKARKYLELLRVQK